MNELSDRFGDKLVILAFPCNQFGHQENTKEFEILNSLKYVRPGAGFEPKAKLFSKIEVNGKNTHPVFDYLKRELPSPSDNAEELIFDPKFIQWAPVKRSDVSWNFEKFLIGPDGIPIRRYSRVFRTADIAEDIEKSI